MNFLVRYTDKYSKHETLLSNLNYCYTFRAWEPQNRQLFYQSKDEIKEFHTKNFATDFIDALSVFSKVKTHRENVYPENGTIFYKDPWRYIFNYNLENAWHDHCKQIFWNPNCEIIIDGWKVSFNFDDINLKYTRMIIEDKCKYESCILVERAEGTLKEHVENCIMEVKIKIIDN
jgi:hypothetical protein